MNAPVRIPQTATVAPSDATLLACDGVIDFASIMIAEASALLSAASSGDVPAVEARLWTCRRTLTAAIQTWREGVPALPNKGGAQ